MNSNGDPGILPELFVERIVQTHRIDLGGRKREPTEREKEGEKEGDAVSVGLVKASLDE